MADIFSTDDVRDLFRNKFVFMLGDSNMRATYKDLVQLINRNALLDGVDLRRRGEDTFLGDKRIVYSGLMKGRGYAEGREFLLHGVHIEYHFITRCYTEDIVRFLHLIKDGSMKAPDVFIMNSCLWDISRWGPDGVDTYKENMNRLMILLKECLPQKTLFIWTTTLPVSSLIRGGLLIKQIDFLQDMLRFEVMEANLFCRHLVVNHGFDVLDTHYHLRMQIHRRLKDGLHYGPLPVRFITNLILTHISLSWDFPLPGRAKGIALTRVVQNGFLPSADKTEDIKLPQVPKCLTSGNQENKEKTEPKLLADKETNKRNFNNNIVNRRFPRQVRCWEARNRNWDPQRFELWDNAPRNEATWNISQRAHPPWQQRVPEPQNQNFWQDTIDRRSNFADFDRVGGPVRNNKFNKRTRPY